MRSIESIIDTLNGIKNLPTLPIVMQKLSAAIRDPNSDARSIARLIEDDPAISARILKVVNSSLYGGGVKIETVQQAVSRLGMTATNNIALSTSILNAFDSDRPQSFDRSSFWRHSICVGIASCIIYDHAATNLNKRQNKETLHLVGILHDVGKLILDLYMYEDFQAALQMAASESIPLSTAELDVVGIDHATIGGWILGKWNMADELMLPTLWHHDPNSAPKDHWELTAIVHVGNYVCNLQKIGDGGDLYSPTFEQAVWKRLGLSVGDISIIVDEVEEEAAKSDILDALL